MANKKENFKILCVSSLDKVFPDGKPVLLQNEGTAFSNETYNYQVCVYKENLAEFVSVEVESELKPYISVRFVESMPAILSQKKKINDDYVIFKKKDATVYPDLLRPIDADNEVLRSYQWSTFWITVNAKGEEIKPGKYDITVIIKAQGNEFAKTTFTLTILDAILPEHDFIYTNWMHYDAIANYYKVEPFTPRFYEILNTYIDTAVRHGLNLLYTPMFTPPLDTSVGRERRTAQLIGVEVKDGEYIFSFNELEKFMDNALSLGVKYFEMSHIASQWGAKNCPKIVATVDGKTEKIFGWDDDSVGEKYLNFLDKFFEKLNEFIVRKGFENIVFFHISDEPNWAHKDNFVTIKSVMKKHLPYLRLMDAISQYAFAESKIIDMPFVCTSHVEDFIAHKDLHWVYYCSYQRADYLSNRFLNHPSQRNRIIGVQMYANGCSGLLHWGFNFYNSGSSRRVINPFMNTDCGGVLEAGDGFIVYPGDDGAWDSLRHEVFGEGVNDYRALKLYESLVGKEKVMELLKKEKISGFSKYPRSGKWHIKFREKLNALIMENK